MDKCAPCKEEEEEKEAAVFVDCDQITRDVQFIYDGVSVDDSAYTRQKVARRMQDLYDLLDALASRLDEGAKTVVFAHGVRLKAAQRRLETSVAQLVGCMLAREFPRDSEQIRLLLVLQAYADGIRRALVRKGGDQDTSQPTMVLDSWLASVHWDTAANATSSQASDGHWAQKCTQCTSVSACRHRPAPPATPVHTEVANADVMRCALEATRMLLCAPGIQTSGLQDGLDRICLAQISAARNELLSGVLRSVAWASSKHRQPTYSGQQLAEHLEAIANAAEGDMGRTAFRDLMLSFQLPRSVVGCRRGLLLQAAAHSNARLTYGTTLHRAHTRAMLGSMAVWKEPSQGNPLSDLEKSCALLSGLAMLLSTGQSEHIRSGVAFEGLVILPFLMNVERTIEEEHANGDDDNGADELAPLPEQTTKHRIYMHCGMWMLCYLKGNGALRKVVEGIGLEGLKQCVVALLTIHDAAK